MQIESFTNRELLDMAMPLVSLARAEWRALLNLSEKVDQGDSDLAKALETVMRNQARVEARSGFIDYHEDEMDSLVLEKSVPRLRIA